VPRAVCGDAAAVFVRARAADAMLLLLRRNALRFLTLEIKTLTQHTQKVPFSMILLMDHVRTKRGLSEDVMRCRMVRTARMDAAV
jgi:hypothetical protein